MHLTGWTWRGRYRRRIPLEVIERVQWWAVIDDVNFILHLEGGEAVPLRLMQSAGTWNCKIHALLGRSLLAQHELPGVQARREVAA